MMDCKSLCSLGPDCSLCSIFFSFIRSDVLSSLFIALEVVIIRHIKEASEQTPMAKTALPTQGKHKWRQEVFNLTVS